MAKSRRYRPTNWSLYNQAKVAQGNIFLWINNDIADWWYDTSHQSGRGTTKRYSALCIETCQTLRCLLRLPLRQTEGFVTGLLSSLGFNLATPDYSTLGRRTADLPITIRQSQPQEDIHLAIDSSGLQCHRGNNWHPEQYGQKRRRPWVKLHLAVDTRTGEIMASTVTDGTQADSGQVAPLLAQCADLISTVYADGGYDRTGTYAAIAHHQPDWPVNVIIPPIKTSRLPEDPTIKLNQRQQHLLFIQQRGSLIWHYQHHYGRRMKAETTFARFKALFGEKLLSRARSNQLIESAIKVKLLNYFNTFYQAGFKQIAC